jgi:hypothetical protein
MGFNLDPSDRLTPICGLSVGRIRRYPQNRGESVVSQGVNPRESGSSGV